MEVPVRTHLYQDRQRALSFGADPVRYDRTRPSYPPGLLDDLLGGATPSVVDVGCGTGIVSRTLRDRGCQVLGVEPDDRMAAFARSQGLEVETATFEGWSSGGRTFELLTAGQSWHWVNPVAGARKAAEVLEPQGRAGVFWNRGRHDPEMQEELDAIYGRLAPNTDEHSVVLGHMSEQRFDFAEEAFSGEGRFERVERWVYPWDQTYSTADWLDQLPTHSDHQQLDPAQLTALLEAIGDAIERRGGTLTMRYQAVCVTGVRR